MNWQNKLRWFFYLKMHTDICKCSVPDCRTNHVKGHCQTSQSTIITDQLKSLGLILNILTNTQNIDEHKHKGAFRAKQIALRGLQLTGIWFSSGCACSTWMVPIQSSTCSHLAHPISVAGLGLYIVATYARIKDRLVKTLHKKQLSKMKHSFLSAIDSKACSCTEVNRHRQ